jgi:WD40 repeat protein
MAPSHANRVYGVKFIDDNTLMSAGWDKTILIWDVRCKESVSYIYGPEICGDSLDYNNNKILAGNFRENN